MVKINSGEFFWKEQNLCARIQIKPCIISNLQFRLKGASGGSENTKERKNETIKIKTRKCIKFTVQIRGKSMTIKKGEGIQAPPW